MSYGLGVVCNTCDCGTKVVIFLCVIKGVVRHAETRNCWYDCCWVTQQYRDYLLLDNKAVREVDELSHFTDDYACICSYANVIWEE